MVGGSDYESPRLAYETASKWGGGATTVVGQPQRLAAPWAAFVNGAAAHALDFNAWDEPSASHSSPVLLDLRAQHGFTAENVAHITARIPFYNASILPYTHPTDDTQARFCMAYCLAIALLNGAVGPADFTDAAIHAPTTRAWLDRITLEAHLIAANSSDLTQQESAIVTVTLRLPSLDHTRRIAHLTQHSRRLVQ